MGTNYYWESDEQNTIHIGKSSAGWVFALHVTDEITSLDDWKKEFKKLGYIRDSNGDRLTPEQMIEIITVRKYKSKKSPIWFATNHAMPGPNGLARSQVDGTHCVGNGDGTWDLFIGEFC